MVEDRAREETLPLTEPPRGVVVAFRPRRPHARGMPGGPVKIAEKAAPLIQLYEGRDVVLNDAWDSLLTLVLEAWCWRDPDCLAEVEACLAHLRRSVDQDWF